MSTGTRQLRPTRGSPSLRPIPTTTRSPSPRAGSTNGNAPTVRAIRATFPPAWRARLAAQDYRVDGLIRAAGGVGCRRGTQSRCEVALVHRPRYDDWTLPKGKLKRGEHPLVAACREVWEETGVQPRAAGRLPTVSYRTGSGADEADKVVDYWAMTVSR